MWSPDNNILYTQEKNIYIQPTTPGKKATHWKAHDGIVLTADWSPANNLIISGGEDCKYRVWDSYGRQLYCSASYDHVITSVKWSPNGDVFAVGAFEMIRLCDKSGWSYSFNKHEAGSIMKLDWNRDGTVVAGAGGNGGVLFGYIVDRGLNCGNIEVLLDENNKINVSDCLNEMNDELDFKDRVVTMSLKHQHLVVATTSQVFIYDTQNWTSPFVIEIKEPISLIIQGAKYMVLIDSGQNLNIYNYEGRLISSPKSQGLRVEFLNKNSISISSDVIGIIDTTNSKIIRIFEVSTGQPTNINIENSNEIVAMQLNQTEISNERKLCFIDFNRDMFLTMVNKPEIIKISSMVDSFQWNDNNDMLCALADGKLNCWFYPNAIYVDKDLMEHSKSAKDASDIGKLAQISHFTGNMV